MPIVIIPGYAEEVGREHSLREEAFIASPEFICGIEVTQFTLERFALLSAFGSPFLCGPRGGGDGATAEDVALFMWSISPEYERALRTRGAVECFSQTIAGFLFWSIRYRFVKRLRKIKAGDAIGQIGAYLDRALYDAPKGIGSSDSVPYWASLAGVVCMIASQTGWSESELLKMPTRRVFQYSKIAAKLRNPDAIMFNPSDSVKSKWAREQIEKAKND